MESRDYASAWTIRLNVGEKKSVVTTLRSVLFKTASTVWSVFDPENWHI